MITVVFTVNNRPHYLREVLRSWRDVRGAGSVRAVFSCEPGCPEAVELCESAYFFGDSQVLALEQRAGVLVNPWVALSSAFAGGAEFVVLAEEDLVVSSDVVEYFTWAQAEFRDDRSVLAVSACQQEPQPPATLGAVSTYPWFQCWVWGTWADRWADIGPDWDKDYRHRGWDHRLNDYWVGERGYRVAAPCVSRSQHIGREGGTHMQPAEFERLQARRFHLRVPPQVYTRLP